MIPKFLMIIEILHIELKAEMYFVLCNDYGSSILHNMAKTFDGPPTLERSGSEHRVGRLHPSFLRREGMVRMWSSPCRRDGEVEKTPSLTVRKDG